jgi:hypothetical protein
MRERRTRLVRKPAPGRPVLDDLVKRERPRKWSDGGGTGLVDWTGDMGPGMDIDATTPREVPK